jgi:CRP-like cAMP-binding protein
MYFKQADMLAGLGKVFVRDLMKLTHKESHDPGHVLFTQGEDCRDFYILLKGQVKLTIGETGHTVYIVSHAGEAFGWSSIIGREAYSATAECAEPTKLLRIDRNALQLLLNNDPANGMIFHRHLSEILGNRLLMAYDVIAGRDPAEEAPMAGTGQLQQATEPV